MTDLTGVDDDTCEECGRSDFETRGKLNQHRNAHRLAERNRERAAAARAAAARAEQGEDDPAIGKQPTRARGTAKRAPFDRRIAAGIGSIGGGVYMGGQVARNRALMKDGALLVDIAPEMGAAWAEVATESDVMRRLGELLAGGSAWGAFAIVVMKLAMGVATNHGWMPTAAPADAGPVGMPNPADMLAAMGITEEQAMQMAQAMFSGNGAGGREPLRPEPGPTTGAAVAGEAAA